MADFKRLGKGVAGALAQAKQLAAAEREANLAKFLAKSQVKEPVFHAAKTDVKQFSPKHRTELSSMGHHFGTAEQANTRTGQYDFESQSPNVGKYHLNVENPLEVSHMASYAPDHLADTMMDMGMLTPEKYDALSAKHRYDDLELGDELVKVLKKNGYDGLKYSNEMEGEGFSYVPFNPAQIKSATGNQGTYDLTSPDLSKADGGKIAKGAMGALTKAKQMAKAQKGTQELLPAAERDENLQKFLGNSRIRERLYHATPKNFNQFKPGGDDPTLSGPAIWLTPDATKQPAAHNIGGGSRGFKEGVNVMPVYAQARSPLMLDDRLSIEWAREVFADGSREFPELISPKTVAELKKEGYDSIIHADPFGNRGGEQEIIMFEPNKIKSAIGNRGTYDIEDADITKAKGGVIHMANARKRNRGVTGALTKARNGFAMSEGGDSGGGGGSGYEGGYEGDYGVDESDGSYYVDGVYYSGNDVAGILQQNIDQGISYDDTLAGASAVFGVPLSELQNLMGQSPVDESNFLPPDEKHSTGYPDYVAPFAPTGDAPEVGYPVDTPPPSESNQPYPDYIALPQPYPDYIAPQQPDPDYVVASIPNPDYIEQQQPYPDYYAPPTSEALEQELRMLEERLNGRNIDAVDAPMPSTPESLQREIELLSGPLGGEPAYSQEDIASIVQQNLNQGVSLKDTLIGAASVFKMPIKLIRDIFNSSQSKINYSPINKADGGKIAKGVTGALTKAKEMAQAKRASESKIADVLESQQAPMTRPQGTGLPLMPRDYGMYTLREQKDLPRMPMVDKARAEGKSPKYNERMQDLLDSPKARKKVDNLINKGKDLNVQEWYGTEPLRQVALDAGRTPEQFESLMAQLASASQRNPVDKQNQMGSYLYHLSETGQLPENSLLLTNKLKKELKDNPSLAEGRKLIELPKGYGSLAQGDIFNRAVMIGQGDIAGALPPNKKLGTFYENLLGNVKPVTVDVNALRGPIIEQGDPRWLTSKLVEKDETGKIINSYKPREMYDSGEMSMREAQQRPGFWEAAPSGSEYAGFEELWQRGAKRHGIEPAEAQALGWYGSADVTALKTKPENYVDNLERLIKRTAEQTGKSPSEIMNDMVTGKGFLRKEGGAVNREESKEDMARFHKRFAMHKAIGGHVKKMAGGGKVSIFDAPAKRMAGGGKVSIFDAPAKRMAKGGSSDEPTAREVAEQLGKLAIDQGKEEYDSYKKPRAATDIGNRGILAPALGLPVDMINMGLGGVDALTGLMGKPTRLSSEKPFAGSEHIKDLMNKYNMTSGEDRPMTETMLSLFSPTGMIKGAQGVTKGAVKAAGAMRKPVSGLGAMREKTN